MDSDRLSRLEKKAEEHDKRFDEIDKRFDAHDKRFDEVDKRFDEHDKRFDEHDKRFDEHDKRFDEHDNRFDLLDERVDLVVEELAELRVEMRTGFDAIQKSQNVILDTLTRFLREREEGKKLEKRVDRLEVAVFGRKG